MIIERKRTIAAPPATVIALLTDVDRLGELVPQAERVEILQRGEGRARIAFAVRAGKLGRMRLEGEARLLPDGLRFIAVTPTQLDLRWTVRPVGEGSEVVARLDADLGKMLGPLGRFVPNQMIERQAGTQFEVAFDALERLATTPPA